MAGFQHDPRILEALRLLDEAQELGYPTTANATGECAASRVSRAAALRARAAELRREVHGR